MSASLIPTQIMSHFDSFEACDVLQTFSILHCFDFLQNPACRSILKVFRIV